MQLKIEVGMWNDDELDGTNHTIGGFEDIDRLSTQVARAVRRWARQIPLRKAGSRTVITLDASWSEHERKPSKE
jgi:hypothetical protein